MRRAALLAMLLAAPGAWAQEVVSVRVGNHPGHGRIVFDWRAPPDYRLEQAGDAVVLHFPPGAAIDLSGARRLPRNIAAVAAAEQGIRIGLKPGARARVFRVGPKLVLDAFDPTAERPPAPVAQAMPLRVEAAPGPAVAPLPVAAVAPPVAPQQAPAAAPPILPVPGALAVRPMAGGGILLPYPAGTGAAVLRRGGQVLALFDSAEPLDLATLRNDPVYSSLQTEPLAGATLLRLPLDAAAQVGARREANGWVIEIRSPTEGREPVGRAVPVEAEGGVASRLLLRARQPGRILPIVDPESGLPLLVGTLLEAGQVMPVIRRLPELDLLPTQLGVAVLARADQVTMRPTGDGFLIGAGTAPLALDPAAAEMSSGEAMTRSFDLPRMAPAQSLERLRALQASIAAAPALRRLPLRRAAAETLLALGLPQEAQAMCELAKSESPQGFSDARLKALAGAAALLAGRHEQAAVLRGADLPETDEIALWRALLLAAEGESQAAASALAASLSLLFDYPEGLRVRLLPPVAMALAEAGATGPLKQLLDRAGSTPELALPNAMLTEATGEVEAALAAYDMIVRGRDRFARARALRRGVELRLATKRIDAAQAARALEATLFSWRGDAKEAAARIRLAELRSEAKDSRGALALLRETEALFPDRATVLRPAIHAAFLAALEQEAPLTAVALFDAYPELLPQDGRGEAAMLMLADRLVALDLDERAAVLLGQAAQHSTGLTRAALGLRQATLRFADGDAAAALAALGDSAAESLPSALARERLILAARASARLGRMDAAVSALAGLGPAGGDALSQILAERQDWAAAAAALADYLRATLPDAPAPLDEAGQRLLVRQAAMLALAGDESGLAALRTDYASRLPPGGVATAFTLLTAEHLRGLADLPRLQRELLLFQSVPSRLEALRAGGPVTR